MRFPPRIAAVALLAVISMSVFAKDARVPSDTRVVGVVFEKGAETTQIADETKGNQPVMYRFKPKKGQLVAVELRPRNQNTEFILFAPGKWPGTELHDSAAKGSRQYNGQVDRDGMHAILGSRSAGGSDAGSPVKYDLVITLKNAAK